MALDPNEALGSLYDAVAFPEMWQDAMHKFARSAGSVGCLFLSRETETVARTLPASPVASDFIRSFVDERWYEIDLTAERGWPLVGRSDATFLTDDDLSTPEERRRHQYFQDFRFKWSFQHFGAIGFKVGGAEWCLSLLRTAKQGNFRTDEIERLIGVAPHLSRVIQLAEAINASREKAHLEALNALRQPGALIGQNGSVLALSRALAGC